MTHFITYKMLSGTPTMQDYIPIINMLKAFGKILDEAWETDSKGKLHYHCHYSSSKKNPYWKLFVVRNFSMQVIPVYDSKGLKHYLCKECRNTNEQSQLCDSVYARHNYLF